MDYTVENEYLSLIINYPELLERNILIDEYFQDLPKMMFQILIEEYKKSKVFILEKLFEYNNFDFAYYTGLLTSNIYTSTREIKFEELQKEIISKYKKRKYKEIIESYDGDYEENYKELGKLTEINYQENSYITYDDVIEMLKHKNKRINLGYNNLDFNLNLSENDMLILAGGTGGGKTAYALNLLLKLSKDYQCIYFNMEMSKNILYKRLCSISTGIELRELDDTENMSKERKLLIAQKIKEIDSRKIILLNGSQKIDDIKKNILNIKTDKHIIVFLDHIGLIRSAGSSLYEKMTNIAKNLRMICLDCNCTIIGLCQLSRESQKMNTPPKLQDLRDSGEIEQSARKVIMLYNKTNDNSKREHDMEIIIAKNDDGNKCSKEFIFDRHTQRFTEKH